MCALSPSALIPIENFRALFLDFLFLRFFKCCVQDKKKLNEIATPFQRHYLQFCFLLSVNLKGLSKKNVWTCLAGSWNNFLWLKNHLFFVETCENFKFFIFFRILLVQVEENYTNNNDLQYFFFQIKIANAIFHADEVLQRRGALRDSL